MFKPTRILFKHFTLVLHTHLRQHH